MQSQEWTEVLTKEQGLCRVRIAIQVVSPWTSNPSMSMIHRSMAARIGQDLSDAVQQAVHGLVEDAQARVTFTA